MLLAPFEPIRVQLPQHRAKVVVLEVLRQDVVRELEGILDEDGGPTSAPADGLEPSAAARVQTDASGSVHRRRVAAGLQLTS